MTMNDTQMIVNEVERLQKMKLDDYGCVASRTLPDGRIIGVVPLLFNAANLCIGRVEMLQEEYPSFNDCWFYTSLQEAMTACIQWQPDDEKEPCGWTRHPGSNRRRIDGNPDYEYATHDEEMAVRERMAANRSPGTYWENL